MMPSTNSKLHTNSSAVWNCRLYRVYMLLSTHISDYFKHSWQKQVATSAVSPATDSEIRHTVTTPQRKYCRSTAVNNTWAKGPKYQQSNHPCEAVCGYLLSAPFFFSLSLTATEWVEGKTASNGKAAHKPPMALQSSKVNDSCKTPLKFELCLGVLKIKKSVSSKLKEWQSSLEGWVQRHRGRLNLERGWIFSFFYSIYQFSMSLVMFGKTYTTQ